MATTDDLLKMTYSNIKSIPSRNVCQIVLECPLEQMEAVFSLLGAPNPKAEPWVVVARLKEDAAEAKGGRYAQQAGIMCTQGAFIKWMGAADADEAAQMVRDHCGVLSRARIDGNDAATAKFIDLKGAYDLWLRSAA